MKSTTDLAYLFKQKAIGLSIEIREDSSFEICGLEVGFIKREMCVLKILSKQSSIEGFCKQLPRSIPVYICVNGRGILQKTLPESSFTSENYFRESFPHSRASDFYYQSYKLEGDKRSFSVIRKDQLDALITQFQDNKVNVCGLFLGNEILSNISSFILLDFRQVVHGIGQVLTFNGGFSAISKSDEKVFDQELEIDGFTLDIPLQISFACGVIAFISDKNLVPASIPSIDKAALNYRKNLFKGRSMLLMTAFFFAVLFANTLLNLRLKSEAERLEFRMIQNEDLLKEVESLKADLAIKKNAALKVTTPLEKSNSFYADRIASIVPESMILKRIEIFPFQSNPKDKNETYLPEKAIIMEGFIAESDQINVFMAELNVFPWVKEVKLLSLDGLRNSHESHFTLKVEPI